MNVKWKSVNDIAKYVNETLHKEAEDIPQSEIDQGLWYLDKLDINQVNIDQKIISEQEQNSEDIQRRDSFIKMINEGQEVDPLIVLWKDVMLVDGYARYNALKKLGITEIQVFRQKFD